MKAQTSAVIFILAILIFIGLFVFIFSFARNIEQREYMNIYTSNLLLSMTRASTGYTSRGCTTITDLLFCKFGIISESPYCDGTPCGEIADRMVNETLAAFSEVKSGYDYFFIAEPQPPWSPKINGMTAKMEIGTKDIRSARREKFTASKSLLKADEYGQYILKVTIYVAKKG